MTQVAIVSDSTHYLPPQLIRERDIFQISLYVGWGQRRARELDLTDSDAFYRRLANEASLPTTAQPSIGDFLAVWEPLLRAGREIVSIHLAGGISGTVQTARQAQAMLAEREPESRVSVIDSRSGCGGLGLLLLCASAAAQAGATRAEVLERLEQARRGLQMWFCIDTLEYLQRGGRIGKAQAWIGSTLKIKPILTLANEITPMERVRTAGRAFERMVAHAAALHDLGSDDWAVQHIQAPERADQLAERCQEAFGTPPLFVSEVGPVIGTYTGPGLIGLGAIPGSLARTGEPVG